MARVMVPVAEHPFPYSLGILKLRGRFRRPVAQLLEQFLVDWFSGSAPAAGSMAGLTACKWIFVLEILRYRKKVLVKSALLHYNRVTEEKLLGGYTNETY